MITLVVMRRERLLRGRYKYEVRETMHIKAEFGQHCPARETPLGCSVGFMCHYF